MSHIEGVVMLANPHLIALHESGHVAAALKQGFRVTQCSVVPSPGTLGSYTALIDDASRAPAVYVAGTFTEALALSIGNGTAAEVDAYVVQNLAGTDLEALRLWANAFNVPLDDAIKIGCMMASVIFDNVGELVYALADELLEKQALNEAEILAIAKQFQPG